MWQYKNVTYYTACYHDEVRGSGVGGISGSGGIIGNMIGKARRAAA